jgi:predicted TIM-barrel fold metal-dependent hydrolase
MNTEIIWERILINLTERKWDRNNKMLFGSDFPLLTPDRWLADFEKIEIRPEVRPLILRENAIKLLGLDASNQAEATK